jgi:uncharacterized membrane protein YqiK
MDNSLLSQEAKERVRILETKFPPVEEPVTQRRVTKDSRARKARYKEARSGPLADFKAANLERETMARKKIADACQALSQNQKAITLRAIARLTRCNHNTIMRHSDIWKA